MFPFYTFVYNLIDILYDFHENQNLTFLSLGNLIRFQLDSRQIPLSHFSYNSARANTFTIFIL